MADAPAGPRRRRGGGPAGRAAAALVAEDGRIRRRYPTQGWKSAVILVATIGHLAEAAWHHPEVTASYGAVEVRLSSHDADGVTERDLALAARIEEVVAWRPGDEDGPLGGTPDDPRFAHVLPDG